MQIKISSGAVHELPLDLKNLLLSQPRLLPLWEKLTPLARNEWICWLTSVKKEETRKEHLRRIAEDLLNGKKRPCCWPGCRHR